MVHGHVAGFLKSAKERKDVQIVGIFDPDAALVAKYGLQARLTSLPNRLNALLGRPEHPIGGLAVTLDGQV